MMPTMRGLCLLVGICVGIARGQNFNRIATFTICSQLDATCNTDTETVAEIVAVSADGMMLVYGDSANNAIGFVDISDPSAPVAGGTLDMGGEVTSVGVTKHGYVLVGISTSPNYTHPSGELKVVNMANKTVVRTMDLGGQPDAVAISPDTNYAAIAIENERDEDLGDGGLPQMPAGFLVMMDTSGDDPHAWTKSDVNLTGLSGISHHSDPEPEFVAISSNNVAVVTLQENNGLVLVDLTTGTVTANFTAGAVDLQHVDIDEEGIIAQNKALSQVPREPDGVTWIGTDHFVTADEGDMDGGSRGFTIFSTSGDVVYSSGNMLDHMAARLGHYPEERSGNKGNEPENVAFGQFGSDDMLFVNSERSNLVFVFNVTDPASPKHLQTLPAGVAPEGGVTIPSRNLLVVASEKDDRGDKIRSVLNIYHYGSDPVQYPTLVSVDRYDGTPIAWSAMSGLAAGLGQMGRHTLYAVEDSFYSKNRIFKINVKPHPAHLTQEIRIVDTNDVFASISPYGEFSASDHSALINSDKTVNIDPEGIAVTKENFWVASEGRGTVGDSSRPVESLNFLFKVDFDGVIHEVVTLPDEVNDIQVRYGFEGVAVEDDYVVVAFQRAWDSEAHPRLGIYNTQNQTWKFVMYPLDTPDSQNGGWVGLSDISALGDGEFLVLERDNQGGPDASIKKIYKIELGDLADVVDGSSVTKTLFRDLITDLKAPGGLVAEKVEGMAVTSDGNVWIVNDNDGVDDNSGETQLLDLGQISSVPKVTTCGDIKQLYKDNQCCGQPEKVWPW